MVEEGGGGARRYKYALRGWVSVYSSVLAKLRGMMLCRRKWEKGG